MTREGEAVKLSSPAAEDTTTCTISQSEPGGEMVQPIKTRGGGGRKGPMRIRRTQTAGGLRIRITLMRIRILITRPYPNFHSGAETDPTFQFEADTDPDPTTHFSLDLDPPMLQSDPLRLPPFHFDADSDPSFHFDADSDPDLAFHFAEDPDPAFQNDADPDTASQKLCGSMRF